MINGSNLYRLYDLFGEIIFFGFSNQLSSEYIEERISNSIIFKQYLDRGDDSFVDTLSQREIFAGTYNLDMKEEDLHKLNTICMWLGEAYLRLYFKYHKSISFIFLYFPINKMTNMFNVYHEMDWPHLYQYFESEIKKKSVLSLLLKKRQITTYELSVLTGIKYQTIKNYCRNNSNVYNASFNSVMKISSILHIDENVFMEEINNYIDNSFLDLEIKDIKHLTYYGYRVISYFDKSIGREEFIYDDKLEMLKSKNGHCIKILISKRDAINDDIVSYQIKNPIDCNKIILIIYTNDEIENIVIEKHDFKKIFVITLQSLSLINSDSIKKETIPTILHNSALSL